MQPKGPRKYEAQIHHIVYTHGIDEVHEWVYRHGTHWERAWWTSKLLETLTGDRFTNAQQIAARGPKETLTIRVAGLRLQEKLVKAFLVIN